MLSDSARIRKRERKSILDHLLTMHESTDKSLSGFYHEEHEVQRFMKVDSHRKSEEKEDIFEHMSSELDKMTRDIYPEPSLTDYLYKMDETEEESIWSIHTKSLEYVTDNDLMGDYMVNSPICIDRSMPKVTPFKSNPDVYNVNFKIKHGTYDPNVTIGASVVGYDSWQQEYVIPLDNDYSFSAKVPEIQQDVRILVDTGASKCIISHKLAAQLTMNPKYSLERKYVTLGDGRKTKIPNTMKLVVSMFGFELELIGYVMEGLALQDIVIGAKALAELEARIDAAANTLTIKNRTLPIRARKNATITPAHETYIPVVIVEVPPSSHFHGVTKIRVGNRYPIRFTQSMCFNKGASVVQILNFDSSQLEIHKDQIIGVLDTRSLGQYHVDSDTLKRIYEEYVNFLDDKETVEVLQSSLDAYFEVIDSKITQLRPVEETIPVPEYNKTYPWLANDDVRGHMTDEDIIRKYVNLDESILDEAGKEQFYKMLCKYKKAFSLRDEIGMAPNMKVHLELHDYTPVNLRPFPCKEQHKDYLDAEMRKGCLLGILKPGLSSWNSPVMLIPRRIGPPRIVTDFRHLNSRLVKLNPSVPLVRDAIQQLGASEAEVLSVVDLKDAFHSLRFDKDSMKYVGITPYYGSRTYIYQRLGMGLSVSPAIWQNFITMVLGEITNRKNHMAIMDDCLIHSSVASHFSEVEDLLKALQKNGLKVSPRKCQFFRKSLVYMGHNILINDKGPAITPVKTRIDSITKLNQPTTVTKCKSFCGMVNFLSFYLKDLQTVLAPIYKLTRKDTPFIWSKECNDAFNKIKEMVTQAPVLGMPQRTGLFQLYSDTSKIGCGASLFQVQKGDVVLLGFHSKKLPDACSRYSISELELTGLTINIAAFKTLLTNVDFEAYVDHSALVYICKAKTEPKTIRLQKLLEICSLYSFIVKYQQGKDMLIADFLSRNPDNDMDDRFSVIPIAFYMKDGFGQVTTRSQARKAEQSQQPPVQKGENTVQAPIKRLQNKKELSHALSLRPLRLRDCQRQYTLRMMEPQR